MSDFDTFDTDEVVPVDAEDAAAPYQSMELTAIPSDLRSLMLADLNEAQIDFLLQRTPVDAIFSRQGAGGQWFDYVKIGYVQERLNVVFAFRWDFDVIDKIVFDDEIVIHGKLTVTTPNGEKISKQQFGSAAIKRISSGNRSGQPVSMGNDFKAACSDCIKKCATELGIGSDLSAGPHQKASVGQVRPPNTNTRPARSAARSDQPSAAVAVLDSVKDRVAAIMQYGRAAGMTDDDIKARVAKMTNNREFDKVPAATQTAIVRHFMEMKPAVA